jgi:hypothetical protein
MEVHIHTPAAELDAFHGEAKTLLRCRLSSEFDFATSADDALPRYCVERVLSQKSRDRPVIERITRSSRHFAIGRNLALGNRTNDAAKGCIALLIIAQRILENSSLEVLRNSRTAHAQNYNKGAAIAWRQRGTICRLESLAPGQG